MKFAILMPAYNDWDALQALLPDVDLALRACGHSATIFIVDDGSTIDGPLAPPPLSASIEAVELVRLACNLGHQRAIAVGLAHLNRIDAFDVVVIMDCDGEDRPDDIARLIRAHLGAPGAIVVAQRSRRSEGMLFASSYKLYKLFFKLTTGKSIDFGNFCLIPRSALSRITHMPELWNHLAGAIVRSRAPLLRVSTDRGRRCTGGSSMSFIALVGHGMSAMAAFTDIIFVRILVLSVVTALFASAAAFLAVALRIFTTFAIPGWATTVVGIAFLIIVQVVSLSATAAFMTMNTRNALHFIPAVNGLAFIRSILKVAPHDR